MSDRRRMWRARVARASEGAGPARYASAALGLALALAAAPLVRAVTAELNEAAGPVWPFSLTHCHALATPGCAQAGAAGRRLAIR